MFEMCMESELEGARTSYIKEWNPEEEIFK